MSEPVRTPTAATAGPSLAGRVLVVTGVAQGLGAALARRLHSAGAVVTGCDVRDAAGEAAMGGLGSYRHADVSHEDEVAALLDDVVARCGRLDGLVNNAAVQHTATVAETTSEDLDRVLSVNLKGVFFGCKHAVRVMADGGAIVNVASVLGLVGDGTMAAYCAAKGGVLALTRSVAVQYAGRGIRCNAVCPGDIATPVLDAHLGAASDAAAELAWLNAQYPIGSVASADEVAAVVEFLLGDGARQIVGQQLVVDGGLLARCY